MSELVTLAGSAAEWAGQAWTSPNGHRAKLSPQGCKIILLFGDSSAFAPQMCSKAARPCRGTGLADAGHCGMQHGEHVAPSPTELLGTPTTGTSHPGPFPASAVQSSSTSQVSAWVRKCFLSPFLFPFLSPASTTASEQVGLAELSLHPSQVPQPEPQRWKDPQPTQVRRERNPLPSPE